MRAATQYYLSHRGKLYVVTLTSSVAKRPLAKANKSLDQLISSWSWK